MKFGANQASIFECHLRTSVLFLLQETKEISMQEIAQIYPKEDNLMVS